MDCDFDLSALNDELQRITTDRKPGAPRKTGGAYDKYVKMPKGDGYVTIRLLPKMDGQKFPFSAHQIHNLGDKEKPNNLFCGKTLENRRWVGSCFLCDYYYYLYRQADEARAKGNVVLADQLVAKAKFMKPQEKYNYNAIVRSSNPPTGQTEEDGPLIYQCGSTIHGFILEAVLGNKEMDKEPKGNVFHIEKGRDLKIVKKMKPGGQYPDYSGSEWKDVSLLSKDEAKVQKWLAGMNDIFNLRKVLSLEEMQRAVRIYEGKETDPRKKFDASFLEDDNSVSVSVPANVPSSKPAVKVDMGTTVPDIDDGADLVDDDFANGVRAAIGGMD